MSVINSPREWHQAHWEELKDYVGEWVAYSKDGVIAHDPHYLEMIAKVKLDPLDYIVERVFENEFVEPPKFYPIRFRVVKNNNWQPKYFVTLSYQNSRQINMLVDSGADFCLMSKELGLDLGYEVGREEVFSKAEGVGGAVDYVLRKVDVAIDGHALNVPIAWLQTDAVVEHLLGREVVFDQFDIEFKQCDRQIIFKYRSQS
jgi:hypothetical protein